MCNKKWGPSISNIKKGGNILKEFSNLLTTPNTEALSTKVKHIMLSFLWHDFWTFLFALVVVFYSHLHNRSTRVCNLRCICMSVCLYLSDLFPQPEKCYLWKCSNQKGGNCRDTLFLVTPTCNKRIGWVLKNTQTVGA